MRNSVGTCTGVLAALLLVAPSAAGQSTTEDGIRAMLRGDYHAAARILRPVADDETTPDPVAQFLLAILYESGKGVPPDMERACRLFLRSGTGEHPFKEQSAAIAAIMRAQLGGAASPLCAADERWRRDAAESNVVHPAAANRRVGAQPSSADGVLALARGDHQRAVEILKPVAEDWRVNDTAAQFFMAGLYEAGRGVPVDPLRACALYARAANHEHPVGRQANVLFSAYVGRGQPFFEECQLLARIGFEHGFEPASFELQPGHVVDWTLSAATVTYEGRTSRHETPYAEPGARFLPLRHTELRSGPARALTRHFVEMFLWSPATPSGPWRLRWHIFEIVGDDIMRVGAPEPLVTVEGENPPSTERFDVREYGVLRVDAEGHAEWAVLKGLRPESERIESAAERREVRAEELARDRTLKNTDWTREADVNRQPALTYADADGCGEVQVYGWTTDRTEAISVRGAATDLSNSAQSFTYDLARDAVTVTVEARVYAAPQYRFEFCSHLGMPPDPDPSRTPETWRAVAGIVTLELSPPGVRARAPHLRRATATLTDVVFRNRLGVTVKAPGPIRLTGIVGSFGG